MTKVDEVKKSIGCMRVVFSDGQTVRVPFALFADFRVRAGEPIDPDGYQRLLADHAYPYALDRAAKLLAVKDMTEKNIYDKLISIGYPEAVVARVMQTLERYEFVSDARFSGHFVESRGKRYGRNRLMRELQARGVDGETAREALDALDPADERAAALSQARKLSARKDLNDPADRQKITAALVRRGYGWGLIKDVLNELRSEAEKGNEA
ncbi:MAG: regulatory protein RecX [Clostridia bacterium]|nr:regulatory protein RecX [Clostridia bacterium]